VHEERADRDRFLIRDGRVVHTLERVRKRLRRVDSWRAVPPLLASSVRYCEDRLVEKGFLPGQSQYRKFVVVSRARTGSNLLISLLNSHPQVDARGEMFRRMKGQSVESTLDQVFRRRPRRIAAVGFKIFYYHPLDDHHSHVWDSLRDMDDLYVLHLKRHNVLRTVTSRKLAGGTDIWLDKGRGAGAKEKPAVRFSAQGLEEAFEQNEAWEADCDERFRNHEMMEIFYEDLVSGREVLDHIAGFLGVRPHAMSTSLRQQNPEELAALIANFEELRLHFQGSRWATFFDER
jgi:LPS sulfotransferase NodH